VRQININIGDLLVFEGWMVGWRMWVNKVGRDSAQAILPPSKYRLRSNNERKERITQKKRYLRVEISWTRLHFAIQAKIEWLQKSSKNYRSRDLSQTKINFFNLRVRAYRGPGTCLLSLAGSNIFSYPYKPVVVLHSYFI
jgi:hypothetical protein